MAEFELRMRYATPPAKLGIHALAVLFPFWGILLPCALALFVVLLLLLPANIPLLYSLTLIGSMLGMIGLCTAVALYCDDDQIRVSKEGLSFPLRFLPTLKWRRQFKWDELGALKLKWNRGSSFAADEVLTFFFHGGGFAQLQLKLLNPQELEQFFIAFEACATRCERHADLPDFETAIQTRKVGAALTYTQLWEKSLSNRFSGATFTPLEPNTALQAGRYQILRQMAFGGFSAIYLARSGSEGQLVVVKESSFPQSEAVQSKATELFKREAELLSKLSHPQIARMLDYFVENDRHYLVMQHIEGMDLNRLVMQNGPQEPEVVLEIAWQVAAALVYLNQQSPPVVHRDLTPDNLVARPSATITLIDFGAAKEIVSSFTGTVIGKQGYIAPEQFKGKPTPKSDIYSLGATLYYLSTGKQPEPLAQSDLKSEQSQAPELLHKLILECTSLDEKDRPDSSQLFERLTNALRPEQKEAPLT